MFEPSASHDADQESGCVVDFGASGKVGLLKTKYLSEIAKYHAMELVPVPEEVDLDIHLYEISRSSPRSIWTFDDERPSTRIKSYQGETHDRPIYCFWGIDVE